MLFFAYYIVGKYAISDVAIEHQWSLVFTVHCGSF